MSYIYPNTVGNSLRGGSIVGPILLYVSSCRLLLTVSYAMSSFYGNALSAKGAIFIVQA